jgi:hypothetical protein
MIFQAMAAKSKKSEFEVLSSWEDFDKLEEVELAPVQLQSYINCRRHEGLALDGRSGCFREGEMEEPSGKGVPQGVGLGNSEGEDLLPYSAKVRESVGVCRVAESHSMSVSAEPSGDQQLEHSLLLLPLDHPSLLSQEDEPFLNTLLFNSEEAGHSQRGPEEGFSNLLDLDFDALCRCMELLPLREICMVAQCCRRLREAAYSDPVWQAQYRWVHFPSSCAGAFQWLHK